MSTIKAGRGGVCYLSDARSINRITVVQAGLGINSDPIQKVPKISWVQVAHTCNPSYSEAEIRRISAQSQARKIVYETLSQRNPSQKMAGEVAQGIVLEFKP
jgi:hypothetical protein